MPAEGRLSPGELPVERLHGALAALGPVFADFGRYLSSRIDLLPRRLCEYLGERESRLASNAPQAGFSSDAVHDMNGPLGRRFFKFERRDIGSRRRGENLARRAQRWVHRGGKPADQAAL